jgi:hypothetical protein
VHHGSQRSQGSHHSHRSILRARVVVAFVSLVVASACVAACGDDIRCYAPDESACGVPNASDASDASDAFDGAPIDGGDARLDTGSPADSGGSDVGADAEGGEGG